MAFWHPPYGRHSEAPSVVYLLNTSVLASAHLASVGSSHSILPLVVKGVRCAHLGCGSHANGSIKPRVHTRKKGADQGSAVDKAGAVLVAFSYYAPVRSTTN